MLPPGMACGGALPRADSAAGGQAEPPPKRKRGRPLGSKNKKTLAAQQCPASTAPATGSMLPAQGVPAVAHRPAHAVQGAEAACTGAVPAGAGAQLQAAPKQLHAHAPAVSQVALLLRTGALGRPPGQAGNIYATTLAAQLGNGAARGPAVSLPAAGRAGLPGVCPAKRGRPKGSKDSKPRKPRTPKPAKMQASQALNGQVLEGTSSAHVEETSKQ